MIQENETEWHRIENWIEQKHSFVLYREPQQSICHCLMQRSAVKQFTHISQLNGVRGYVFAPFRTDALHPIVLLDPEEQCSFTLKAGQDTPGGIYAEEQPPSASYSACFASFIYELRRETFRKLVLSRQTLIKREPSFSSLRAFRAAAQAFPYSYVYLFFTPETGYWLGCTPEILLSGGEGSYHTVALAGTQKICGDALPQHWDEKNRQEQRYVTDYLLSCLSGCGITAQTNGPYSVRAGALSHLKTDIHFSLPPEGGLGDLLHLLHPTPAVCGLPKTEAYQFIGAHEAESRAYYAGFLGWLDASDRSDLYVNLRCMQVLPDCFRLYAGGGILSTSQMEDEWQETENKMGAMRYTIMKGYENR